MNISVHECACACPRRHRHWCFFIEHCAHKLWANNDCNTIYSSNDYENNANLSPYIRCTVHICIYIYFIILNAMQYNFLIAHSASVIQFVVCFFPLSQFFFQEQRQPKQSTSKTRCAHNARTHTHTLRMPFAHCLSVGFCFLFVYYWRLCFPLLLTQYTVFRLRFFL